MGFLDWVKWKREGADKEVARANITLSKKTEDAIHHSLSEMASSVRSMAVSDPNHPKWSKYNDNFEQAVANVRGALKEYAREHGHDSIQSLADEIRTDEKLARQRDAIGREPECAGPDPVSAAKTDAAKARPRRERQDGHDIPF